MGRFRDGRIGGDGLAISPAAQSSAGGTERKIVERWMDALLALARAGVQSGEEQELRTGVSAPHELIPHKIAPHWVHRTGMDITWLTERIAVGGGIWTAENMEKVAGVGVTHVIDMQTEFDDTPLGEDCGVVVLWNPTDDDFAPKPPELFQRGVEFAQAALDGPGSKLFIHCAAGIHRAPMMTLAVMASMGWELEDAMEWIETRRPVADFADVYVRSVERYLERRIGERR
ncbi:MAG TPA: dual specificity protein phosphatase [Candidatus Sulfotelmatobacter sp.]